MADDRSRRQARQIEPRPPAGIVAYLDGTELPAKIGTSIDLLTVDEEGWPRPAHLSVGEVLLSSTGEVRLALHAGSSSTANVRRSSRVVLVLVLDGAIHELRFEVVERSTLTEPPLALFSGVLVSTREHRAPYAEVTGGTTYELNDPPGTLRRWERQIEALRKLDG
ncbi:MAG TPA: hypothetical protein VG405_12220 [Solirubrobacteraceae bacterium]|jgi:hypothetical protein|nr:hypothetical protein [Solirubrobacteraceae bacterium]